MLCVFLPLLPPVLESLHRDAINLLLLLLIIAI